MAVAFTAQQRSALAKMTSSLACSFW